MEVTDSNFLTLAYHWKATVDLLFKYDMSGKPKLTHEQVNIICVDVEYVGNGEVVGTGQLVLHIARVHGNHFIPLNKCV